MSKKGAELLEEALALPSADRAELVDRLLISLDAPAAAGLDGQWGSEVENRSDAFERGDVKTISAQEVFTRTRGAKR